MRVRGCVRLSGRIISHGVFFSVRHLFLSLHPNHPDIGTRSFCRCARLCLCPRMSGGACVSLLVCVCLCVGVWGCRCTSGWASPRHNLRVTVFVLLRALVFFWSCLAVVLRQVALSAPPPPWSPDIKRREWEGLVREEARRRTSCTRCHSGQFLAYKPELHEDKLLRVTSRVR